MDLEPVPDMPALIMKGKDCWAAVADLHIGIEVQMKMAGFSIPTQMPKMMRDLESLSKIARNLVLLGDLKHKIPNVGRREDEEIKHLLGRMLEVFDRVVLISGNHDSGIASVLPEGCEGMGSKGWAVQDTGLFHGHVWPSDEVMRCEKIVMGHIHPSVLLKDSIGARNIEKCWLRSSLHEEATLEEIRFVPQGTGRGSGIQPTSDRNGGEQRPKSIPRTDIQKLHRGRGIVQSIPSRWHFCREPAETQESIGMITSHFFERSKKMLLPVADNGIPWTMFD